LVVLHAPVPVAATHERATAEFTVNPGQRLAFVLSGGASNEPAPSLVDAERELTVSDQYWREWIGRFDKTTDYPEAVRRSLLTLRALTHLPTGGLIAAPTTSLPESPGGSLNWDYRYCWLRDATFTLRALLDAGYHEEATAWRDWILRAVAAEPAKLQIMYRVDGARGLGERTIDWLPGYRWSSPVRVGNAAVDQIQVDVYGELLNAMELATRSGIPQSEHGRHIERGIVEHLEQIWNQPGQGLWESRGVPRHYTYSRVMAWVGVDRFLKSAEKHGHADGTMLVRLRQLWTRIHDEVCQEGYDPGLGHFVQHYGGRDLDASLLLLPLVGFLPADDPRMARTIAAVERDLMFDGLVMRQASGAGQTEGAFLACTCWLADCRQLQGRAAEAEEALARVLAVANDLGLLSEEYDSRAGRLSGNFPQALTHLAVINTALRLSLSTETRAQISDS
jgi:GH15 family glucan-1,4-alpha-glucosidase